MSHFDAPMIFMLLVSLWIAWTLAFYFANRTYDNFGFGHILMGAIVTAINALICKGASVLMYFLTSL